MTAADILKRMNKALKDFGTYQFSDKGAREVMDLNEIVEDLNAMPVQDAITVLEEVRACKSAPAKAQYASELVTEILYEMQDVGDERWAELMQSSILEEAFNS